MPRRRRRRSRPGLVYFVVVSGLLIGGSLWLDHHGELVTATVKAKDEQITVQQVPAGAWYRLYRVGVEFGIRDGIPGMATVDLPEDRYDALHPGDTIRVRYLPFFPLLARAAERSTGQTLWAAAAAFTADPFLIPSLLWLLGGIAALWIASRIATSAIVLVGLTWIALAFPLLFPAPRALSPVTAEAMARVTSVTLVTKAPAKKAAPRRRIRLGRSDNIRRLAMPYQVVQLRFTLPSAPDPIVAVDAVDSASVPGLDVGAIVPIRYDPRAPREARLAQGSRTFRERNRYHFLIPALGLGLVGMLGAWVSRERRTRRRAAAPTAAMAPALTPSARTR
jgi:hypothetical protein